MVKSRYPEKLIFGLLAITAASFLISFALLQLSIGILAVIYLTERFAEKRKSFDRISLAVILFGIIRAITIFTSEHFDLSAESFQREAMFYLALFALQFYFKSFEFSKIRSILRVFIAGGFIVAVIGIILFIFTPIERAQSITSGYHTFADYLVVILIAALSYKPEKKEELVWMFGSAAVITGIIISMGRVSIALAFASAIVFVFLNRIEVRKVAGIGALAGVLTLVSFQLNSVDYVKTRMSNPGGLSDRDVLYKGFSEIYAEHPVLGFGPRTFREIFPRLDEFADKNIGSWHNDLMQVYIESGALLLIGYLFLVFSLLRIYYVFLRSSPNDELKKLATGVFGGLTALFLTGLTSSVIFSPTLYLLAAFLISLLSRENFEWSASD